MIQCISQNNDGGISLISAITVVEYKLRTFNCAMYNTTLVIVSNSSCMIHFVVILLHYIKFLFCAVRHTGGIRKFYKRGGKKDGGGVKKIACFFTCKCVYIKIESN